MPRSGKGQKVQAAAGQEYGQAKAQLDSQAVVPIAAQPTAPVTPGPGAQPFNRPTERPNEAGTATGPVTLPPKADDRERRFRAAMQLPIIEAMASRRGAPPHLRNSVRKLKAFIGDVSEFQDRKP